MKKLTTLLFIASLVGCVKPAPQQKQPEHRVTTAMYELYSGQIEVIQIEGCEYLALTGNRLGGIIHKQNCKFCAVRGANK
jgi:hypothetical protein